jgi:hypothetical protein
VWAEKYRLVGSLDKEKGGERDGGSDCRLMRTIRVQHVWHTDNHKEKGEEQDGWWVFFRRVLCNDTDGLSFKP